MTERRRMEITCPRCQSAGLFTRWDRIDAGEEPWMRQAVRDGSAFRLACPDCGCPLTVDYPLRYEEGALLLVKEADREAALTACEGLRREVARGRLVRAVYSRAQLSEKASLFAAGLDDRVVELYKALYLAFFRRELLDEPDGGELILGTRAGRRVISLPGEEAVEMPPEGYDWVRRKYAGALPPLAQAFPVVDRPWAVEFLRGQTGARKVI